MVCNPRTPDVAVAACAAFGLRRVSSLGCVPKSGRKDEAALLLLAVVNRWPGREGATDDLGINAMTGRLSEARRAWEKVLQYNPDDVDAKAYFARVEG